MAEIDYDKISTIVAKIAAQTSQDMQSKIIENMQEVANRAIINKLFLLGIDATDPIAMQNMVSFAKECHKNAEETKKVILWGTKQMQHGDIVRKSFLQESVKYFFIAIAVILAGWVANLKGFFQ